MWKAHVQPECLTYKYEIMYFYFSTINIRIPEYLFNPYTYLFIQNSSLWYVSVWMKTSNHQLSTYWPRSWNSKLLGTTLITVASKEKVQGLCFLLWIYSKAQSNPNSHARFTKKCDIYRNNYEVSDIVPISCIQLIYNPIIVPY